MTLWGWLVFAQVPDVFVIAGALVVVSSGLYLLWVEMRPRPPTTVAESMIADDF